MTKIKLTKSVVDAARAQTSDFELRDTIVPGFICKVTPTGRKVFMLQYRTNSGMRRKPALGQFGELTVELARALLGDIRALIEAARQRAASAVNSELTMLCWRVGHRIHTQVLEGRRADHGEEVLATLVAQLVGGYGNSFADFAEHPGNLVSQPQAEGGPIAGLGRFGRFGSPAGAPLPFLNSYGASYIFDWHSGGCRRAGQCLPR